MNLNRRAFLRTAGATSLLLTTGRAFAQGGIPVGAPPYGMPIIQLHTDDTSAQFRILVNPLRSTIFEAKTLDGRVLPLTLLSRTVNPFNVSEAFDHILVEGLQVGRDYALNAYDEQTGAQVEEREFRALDTHKTNGRFILASCMMDALEVMQDGMFQALENARADVIIFNGDTCYADVGGNGTPSDHWRRHIESRRTFNIFKWRRLVPIYATWDDHDFGGNNTHSDFRYKQNSVATFKALFGWQARGSATTGDTVETHVDLFGQRFFLMDDRYFRDVPGVANGTHWGSAQEAWLLNSLSTSLKPAWLVNGSQFFGGYLRKESYEFDNPQAFANTLNLLSHMAAPVIFASGDVHFSEIMSVESRHLGYQTYELTSSSLLSTTSPWQDTRAVNPRRLASTWRHNFIVVDTGSTLPGVSDFRARCFGAGLQLLFDKSARVQR